MSATFHNMRRRMAAQRMKDAERANATEAEKKPAEKPEKPKKGKVKEDV